MRRRTEVGTFFCFFVFKQRRPSLSSERLHHRAAQSRRAFGNMDARQAHRLKLRRRRIAPAGDDSAGMAHAAAGGAVAPAMKPTMGVFTLLAARNSAARISL